MLPLAQADHLNAELLVRSIARHEPARVVTVVHEGEPLAKERPRFGRGRAYTTSKTEGREKALATRLRAELRGKPFLSNVAVVAIFYRSSRQRIDADNLAKLVMDAATKAGAWADDSQVTAQAAFVELDRERPRTVIALCDTTSSLDRTPGKPRRKGGKA